MIEKDGHGGEMNSYYKEKLEQGLNYQDIVVEELYKNGLPIISYSSKKFQVMIGENKAGIEIKNDNKFRTSGNFYIETAEKSDPNNENFIPSGINRNDNTWLYIIGDSIGFFVFSKKQLKILSNKTNYRKVQIPTSQGFLLPVEEAKKIYCIKEIQITLESK
jgi:hypothetical protein